MKRTIVIWGLVAFGFAAAAEAPAVDPEGLESAVTSTAASGAGPSAFARLVSFAAGSFTGAGAPFMWAILLVSAFSVTVAAEKGVFLFLRATKGDRDTFDHLIRLVRDRRVEEARAVADRSNTPFARIAASVLRVRHGHRSEEVQNLMDEAYLREVPAIGRRIPLLAVSANLATLLGLLGTIVGLIMAFDAVANVPAVQRTAALAAGISIAMATTGFGLVVAIPTLAAHGLLGSRADRVTEEIESRLAVIANLVHEWNRKTQDDPYEESKTGIAERRERLVDYVTAGEIG
ncbi:MAG: MotA/TolQ/ExbB proton channel family protein [Candidatus Eisenbacteria bacterium]